VTDQQITSCQVDVGFNADAPGSKCLEQRYATCVVIVRVYWHQLCVVYKGLEWLFPDYRIQASALAGEQVIDPVVRDALQPFARLENPIKLSKAPVVRWVSEAWQERDINVRTLQM
jgi:hypothetical protein